MAEKEYIEREAIIRKLNEIGGCDASDEWDKVWDMAIDTAVNAVERLPVADVAPVRHGHWKKGKGNERPTESGFIHDDRYFCDCCGWGCCCETKLDFGFCPNCGAKMLGG